MNFLRRLWARVLGSHKSERHPNDQAASNSNINYVGQWEQDRQKRISEAELSLKQWFLPIIQEKGNIEFSWESGHDEAFLTIKDFQPSDAFDAEELELYIIDKLDIPDAGEFNMTGTGTLYIQNNAVRAKYNSELKELVDFDEETEAEVYGEPERESADKELFKF